MIPRATTFQNLPQGMMVTSASVEPSSGGSPEHSSSSLFFNVSVLKEKVSQVQTLVGLLRSPEHHQNLPQDPAAASMAVSSINSTVQEIIVTATSIMFTCQQMALAFPPGTNDSTFTNELHHDHKSQSNYVLANNNNNIRGQGFFSGSESEALDWFGGGGDAINCRLKDDIDTSVEIRAENNDEGYEIIGAAFSVNSPPKNNNDYEIIELDAADLLAKYTHYCQVCAKGFKRDANLRMHMRAHGDEYKTSAALSNPMKNQHSRGFMGDEDQCGNNNILMKPKKYSCPQQGCRWNSKHAKFQPLKSMICAKNHYKRSHCPKMYVCKRCGQKQFSVLSDLRTHEKHCGDLKWQCSCGTTFSRKDKLMGHVSLFLGHRPVATAAAAATNVGMPYTGKLEQQTLQMQMDDEDYCV